MKKFEIGITYVRNSRHYIAVQDHKCFTIDNGDIEIVSEADAHLYRANRRITVEKLCQIWKISSQQLDMISSSFFTPAHCRDAAPSYRTAQRDEKFRQRCRRGKIRLG